MIENKRAGFDFHVEEEYTAGMMLTTQVVKDIHHGKFAITGDYVKQVNGELFLISSRSDSSIKLLLNKSEINRIAGKIVVGGYTAVPLRIIRMNGKFKLVIGVAKGKKAHDKRESAKSRDIDLENRRIIKSQKMLD